MPPPAFLAAIKARRVEPENEPANAPEKPKSATKKMHSPVKVASKLKKYKKMLNMGIPRGAVEQKMRADQLDPAELFAGLPANELAVPVPKQSSKTKKVTKAPAAAEADTDEPKISNNPLIAELQRAQKARADPEFKKKLEEERAARAAAAAAMPERSVLSKKASKLKRDLAALNRKTEGVQKRLKTAGNTEKVAAELDYLQAQRAAAEADYTKEALLAELKAAVGREAKDAVNRKITLLGIHTKMLEARIKLFKMKDELASVRATLEDRPSNSAALIKQRDLTKEIPKLETAVKEAAARLEAAKEKFGIPIPHVAPVSREAAPAVPAAASKDKCVSRDIFGRCRKTRKQRNAERAAAAKAAAPSENWGSWD